jgi:hypothetical protein
MGIQPVMSLLLAWVELLAINGLRTLGTDSSWDAGWTPLPPSPNLPDPWVQRMPGPPDSYSAVVKTPGFKQIHATPDNSSTQECN